MLTWVLVVIVALLAGAVVVLLVNRPDPGAMLGPLLDQRTALLRQELQQGTALLLQPLQADLRRLEVALTEAREQQLRTQAEALATRFEALRGQLQEALLQGRTEQGQRLAAVQEQMRVGLSELQAANDRRLEQIRVTVDEKLHTALEQRLGESFRLVSERLEKVQLGLGEMQTLAQDVGGLKRVLSNVKTRGVLGETQLAALLDQFLVPGQYEAQWRPSGESREAVDFAVRLPGAGEGAAVWIPIDAKFPLDDYQRLLEAQERSDFAAMDRCAQDLERRVLDEARSIQGKYVQPPRTTAFALMFLPSEGLFAEVLRRPGLFERLQNQHHVVVVGPTTLCATLNALQMGFTNLAIHQRSQEVWKVLSDVKLEFGRFATWIQAVQKKVQAVAKEMDHAGTRSRQMERKLQSVSILEGEAILSDAPEVLLEESDD